MVINGSCRHSRFAMCILEMVLILVYIVVNTLPLNRSLFYCYELLIVGVSFYDYGFLAKIGSNIIIKSLSKIQLEFFLIHQLVIRILRLFISVDGVIVVLSFFITVMLCYVYFYGFKDKNEIMMRKAITKFESVWKNI